MITMHRSGTETRTPRQELHKQLFLAKAHIMRLEAELDATLMQNANLCAENERLRESLALRRDIDATCEALGL